MTDLPRPLGVTENGVIDMTDHEHCLDKGECWRVHVPGTRATSRTAVNASCPSLTAKRRTDSDGRPISAMTQCGTCYRWWDDAIITSMTPVPAGRCPFEYDHPSTELESVMSDRLPVNLTTNVYALSDHEHEHLPHPMPADTWLWQSGDIWAAHVGTWYIDSWWEDADPADIAARPERWARHILDVPETGTLRYADALGNEVTVHGSARTVTTNEIAHVLGCMGYGGMSARVLEGHAAEERWFLPDPEQDVTT